ncbi:Degenerin mec-10 [Aphelenchoides bicaudatus]|nr:Degenerin mec-10 [Aphelenchoides bicaudatus]
MPKNLADEVDVRRIARSFDHYQNDLDANQQEKQVQCNLLLDGGGPSSTNYEGWSLKAKLIGRLKQFCERTSSHGVPWLGSAPNLAYRSIWLSLCTFCFVLFSLQAHNLLQKYYKKEKITSIQLNVDSAPFPAITICNLNPYLLTSIRHIGSAQKILQTYKSVLAKVKNHQNGQNQQYLNDDDEQMILEALGFDNMTDEVAIVTKARENIIFAMSALAEESRMLVSTQKHQLIHKCSFNGQACNIDKDFKFTSDPSFGNCFTFNHNTSDPKFSARAGATYGLRLLAYVNTTEYLPITEAVGVRITIHDPDEYPFPETSGYSAPTGFVSSFGVKLTRLSRLPEPYGKCVPDGSTKEYLYQGFQYSLEGCYRTCLQKMAIERCGCGDPRFPVFDADYCQVFDPEASKLILKSKNDTLPGQCLEEVSDGLGTENSQGSALSCQCAQPCKQPSYTVSYSCANWPSESLNISVGKCELEAAKCNEYYQDNGAMIEVFYEALNYEVLTEYEAYGLVKMMADLGGQLGLWSGVSVITCCEVIFLFFELIHLFIYKN